MGNPLLGVTTRPWQRPNRRLLRRTVVDIPQDLPSTDAIFLVLRRMRAPIITVITIMSVSVLGLTLIPAQDDQGNAVPMNVLDAFYFMSYTATTIGFGEINYTFTAAQRLWVTAAIYASVIGWAYSIGSLFALFQDENFREAMSVQSFRRRVQRLDEPFHIVVGYGQTGRAVIRGLDALGRAYVVIDRDRARIEEFKNEELHRHAPALAGDASTPAMLGAAGLGHRSCEGVLALTGDDKLNLGAVMAVHLLRPEVPVIARCDERATEERMRDFDPHAVINPYDDYGRWLILALRDPATFRLLTWLSSPQGTKLPRPLTGLRDGRWVVCADGRFGKEVARDLDDAAISCTLTAPEDGNPEIGDAVGFVAGAEADVTNLSLAAHARLVKPDLYISVRQQSLKSAPLTKAFSPDSVFIPTVLVAREALARVVSPKLWGYIDHVRAKPDEWSEATLARMVDRVGERTPGTSRIYLTSSAAPAVTRWLAGHELRLGELMRHPDDRDRLLEAYALLIERGGKTIWDPGPDTQLRVGDLILMSGRTRALDALTDALFLDSALEYLVTGRQVPTSWFWQVLTRRLPSARRASSGTRNGPLGPAGGSPGAVDALSDLDDGWPDSGRPSRPATDSSDASGRSGSSTGSSGSSSAS